jgi:hypothetical protein
LINKGVGRPNADLVDDVLSETTASYLALHAAAYETAYTSAVIPQSAPIHLAASVGKYPQDAISETVTDRLGALWVVSFP